MENEKWGLDHDIIDNVRLFFLRVVYPLTTAHPAMPENTVNRILYKLTFFPEANTRTHVSLTPGSSGQLVSYWLPLQAHKR